MRREVLCELFWPEYTKKSARLSLRVALSKLRQKLAGKQSLQTTRQTVSLNLSDADFWCDVVAFEQFVEVFADASGQLESDRTAQGFTLSESNLAQVIQLCQVVEGLPLGVELAAALMEQLKPTEIIGSLEADFDRLRTTMIGAATAILT